MGLLDDDVAAGLADQVRLTGRGVVVWRGKTINSQLDDSDELENDAAGEGVIEGGTAVTIATADLPVGALRGDILTVDGVSYRVGDWRKVPVDGLLTRVQLAG